MEEYKKVQWSDLEDRERNIAEVEFNKVSARYQAHLERATELCNILIEAGFDEDDIRHPKYNNETSECEELIELGSIGQSQKVKISKWMHVYCGEVTIRMPKAMHDGLGNYYMENLWTNVKFETSYRRCVGDPSYNKKKLDCGALSNRNVKPSTLLEKYKEHCEGVEYLINRENDYKVKAKRHLSIYKEKYPDADVSLKRNERWVQSSRSTHANWEVKVVFPNDNYANIRVNRYNHHDDEIVSFSWTAWDGANTEGKLDILSAQ